MIASAGWQEKGAVASKIDLVGGVTTAGNYNNLVVSCQSLGPVGGLIFGILRYIAISAVVAAGVLGIWLCDICLGRSANVPHIL